MSTFIDRYFHSLLQRDVERGVLDKQTANQKWMSQVAAAGYAVTNTGVLTKVDAQGNSTLPLNDPAHTPVVRKKKPAAITVSPSQNSTLTSAQPIPDATAVIAAETSEDDCIQTQQPNPPTPPKKKKEGKRARVVEVPQDSTDEDAAPQVPPPLRSKAKQQAPPKNEIPTAVPESVMFANMPGWGQVAQQRAEGGESANNNYGNGTKKVEYAEDDIRNPDLVNALYKRSLLALRSVPIPLIWKPDYQDYKERSRLKIIGLKAEVQQKMEDQYGDVQWNTVGSATVKHSAGVKGKQSAEKVLGKWDYYVSKDFADVPDTGSPDDMLALGAVRDKKQFQYSLPSAQGGLAPPPPSSDVPLESGLPPKATSKKSTGKSIKAPPPSEEGS